MSDIFREVDEDIRREQVRKLWDRFAPYVIGLAVFIVAVTAGYRGWEYWQDRQAQASGDRFTAAMKLSTDGKHAEAITAFEAIAKDSSGSYPLLARFRIATEKAANNDVAGASADFDAIAADTSQPTEIRNVARLRSAMLAVDTATVADLQSRIGDLAGTGNTWRHAAREILGLASWRTGDYAAARKYFTEITNDQDSPQDMRQRSNLMLALIASHLPPEPVTTAPAAVTPPAPDASSADDAPAADAAPVQAQATP
jgi:hypothetical protein